MRDLMVTGGRNRGWQPALHVGLHRTDKGAVRPQHLRGQPLPPTGAFLAA